MVIGAKRLSISVGMSKVAQRWKLWFRFGDRELYSIFPMVKYPKIIPLVGDLQCRIADKSQGFFVIQAVGAIVFAI